MKLMGTYRVGKQSEINHAMEVLLKAINTADLDDFVAAAAMKLMCVSFEKANHITLLIKDKEVVETVH